jgi:hypothetical protein
MSSPEARTARAPRRQSVPRSALEGNEKLFMALCQGRPPLSVYPGKELDCATETPLVPPLVTPTYRSIVSSGP